MSEQSSYHIPQWTAADRLRKARIAAGLSQNELADRIGCGINTISNYETGATTNVRRMVMRQWALATGVPEAWLRDGIEPIHSPDPGTQSARPNRMPDQANDQSGWIHGLAAVA